MSSLKRLTMLAVGLMAVGAMAQSCSCENEAPVTDPILPDVEVGMDAGDVDPMIDDADVVDPPEPDADVPEPEPDADVPEDDADVPEDDADAMVEDENPGNDNAFVDSCLFGLLDGCLGERPEALSCTTNTLGEPHVTAVSYGNARAAQWDRGESNEGPFSFEAWVDEGLCYSASALDARDEPFGWSITERGDGDVYRVERDTENLGEVIVTCADDTTERYELSDIEPWLPPVLVDEPICQNIPTPRCDEDPDCQFFDNAFECCEVAGTARCLVSEACPVIPEVPDLESCLTPLLDCFGDRRVPQDCSIDPNTGITDVSYARSRRAVFEDDGFGNTTLETSGEDGLCYQALYEGDRPTSAMTINDPSSEDTYEVVFRNGEATVTCPDDSTETHGTEDILQYIPFQLTVDDEICEEVPEIICTVDEECPENSKCCETLNGLDCLNVEACPVVTDPWDVSCLNPVFECFGDDQSLAQCLDFGNLDIVEVAYVSGARATYFSDRGRDARRTFFGRDPCFEALAIEGGTGFEVTDLVGGGGFQVVFDGDDARITCPDDSLEVVPRDRVEAYLPAQPGELQCESPVRDDECNLEIPCQGEEQECCDIGDRNQCVPIGTCDDAQPREVCDDDSTCSGGDTCCQLPVVRVCNPRLCGQGQICCDQLETQVCAPDSVCNQEDECTVGDHDTCPGDARCCDSANGPSCQDVELCADEVPPWEASCLFGTFECQGRDIELDVCEVDDQLNIIDADYTSGANVLFYETAGRLARRSSFGETPCFNLVEDAGNDIGFTIQDLVTGENFRVVRDDDLGLAITCPDNTVQSVPTGDMLAYLALPPDGETCTPRERDNLCDGNGDCDEEGGEICCDTGLQDTCIGEPVCAEQSPRQTCIDDGICGDGEQCCALENVVVCDPLLCGEGLCCLQESAQVCGTNTECTREDQCTIEDPVECGDGALCCPTLGGTRCLDDVEFCPDPNDPIALSCIAPLLNCFGFDNELDSCETQSDPRITSASYVGGSEATYFSDTNPTAVRTGTGGAPCYILTQDGDTLEFVDSATDEVYQVQIDGFETSITCPDNVTDIVPTEAFNAFLPIRPELELCDAADRERECQNDQSCGGFPLVCCNVGDADLCVPEEDCQFEESLPREACDDADECGNGEVCCAFPQTWVCDPTLCEAEEQCCLVSNQTVCSTQGDCDAQVFNACDVEDNTTCPGDDVCCVTPLGTRCQEAVDGECPGALVGSCIEAAFECFGINDRLDSCSLRSDPDRTEAFYDNGARTIFEDREEGQFRRSSLGDSDCFEALEREGGFDFVDLTSGEEISLDIDGDSVLITCGDESVEAADLGSVLDFLPPAPPEEACLPPEFQWNQSCLFGIFDCSGPDLELQSCIDYGELVDRTEVDYGDGIEGVFSTRNGLSVVQTRAEGLPCFEATIREGGFDVTDPFEEGVNYAVDIADGVAQITCPDDTLDFVDAPFVLPYLPERPAVDLCDEAPRDDECQQDNECGNGQVCCDNGVFNSCSDLLDCALNEPQVQCDADEDCGDGEFCCERELINICDPELCGDQICCVVPEANVCGTEDACNEIFDACRLDVPTDCLGDETCCEVGPGNRCIPGGGCPPPPDPLQGSCIHLTLQCFGRNNVLLECTDYGVADLTEAIYDSTSQATFFTSQGQPARRSSFGFVPCFDAFEVSGDGEDVAGYQIQDLFDGAPFAVTFDGPDAIVTCSDDSEETVPRSAILEYFPDRPVEGCLEPVRPNECEQDADCAEFIPGGECCDVGNQKLCVDGGTCELNTPHPTCQDDSDCGEGTECCDLGAVRICDPVVCGDQGCCNVFQGTVCGTNAECNTFEDVCNLVENDCPEGSFCCFTNDGSRCFDGLQDEGDCEVPDDPFPSSCLFDTFDCGGTLDEIAECSDIGDGSLFASYEGGTGVLYENDGETQVRRVSRGGLDCFEARRTGEVITVQDLQTGENFQIDIQGANAHVTCDDTTEFNVSFPFIEGYLPDPPAPERCEGPQDAWQGSCLFGLFECFGADNAFESCVDFGVLDHTDVTYGSGNTATFYANGGAPVMRTGDVNEQICYRAEGSFEDGFDIDDLLTGEEFSLRFEGDRVQIFCPDETSVVVPSALLTGYLPSRPLANQCEDFERNDECQQDNECGNGEVCCPLGLENVCLDREGCEVSQPRPICDNDNDCGDGTICCDFTDLTVCDPDVCNGEACCGVNEAQVCATEDRCNGIFDVCELDDPTTCTDGFVCCESEIGQRCVLGECPPPPDPIVDSCIGDTLVCFGNELELDACDSRADLGIIEATYLSGSRAQFFSRDGRAALATYLQDVPCFTALELEDGTTEVVNAVSGDSFILTFAGGEAQILCEDNTLEVVPEAGLRTYLPPAPNVNQCEDIVPVNDCTNNETCRQLDESFICCDTDQGGTCTTAEQCLSLAPSQLCEQDSECGEGVGCCQRALVRVCDPILCGGELCCDLEDRQVCGGTPEGCQLQDSCLADVLNCAGDAFVQEACFDFDPLDVLESRFESGASIVYFQSEGREARRVRFDDNDCYEALATADPGGYDIVDSATGDTYAVRFQDGDALITCADDSQETVTEALIQSFFPAAPQDQCLPFERDDECQENTDCEQLLGPGSLCCDSGVRNICSPEGTGCEPFTPQETCGGNEDCPEGQGCCEEDVIWVCDPVACGDELCCAVDSAPICTVQCLLCQTDDDCQDGDLCCPFTNECAPVGECAPPVECTENADCGQGFECCRAGQQNICITEGECPNPCSSDADCPGNQLCCGSQSSVYGAHCTAAGNCADEQPLDCTTNSDCGNGELCCRTLDAPACVTAEDCPVACIDGADCGQGQECCQETTRTPVCVDEGTCRKRRGEQCDEAVECGAGLTCCPYDILGPICIEEEHCDGEVTNTPCEDDPSICGGEPMAVCCAVGDVPVCSVTPECDIPFFPCLEGADCGASGYECCPGSLENPCIAWIIGSCEGGQNPF